MKSILFLICLGRQIITPISQPVEEELHPKQHPVEYRRTARQQNRYVQWQECEQQERRTDHLNTGATYIES